MMRWAGYFTHTKKNSYWVCVGTPPKKTALKNLAHTAQY